MKKLAAEASRTYSLYQSNGFFTKYMSGFGLDVGYRGYSGQDIEPILPTAIGIDTDYPGYDGKVLPFGTNSQDYVYSSHCLEHVSDYKQFIKELYRVLKVNSYMVITVPHKFLYEKKASLPSNWNQDHKRFYTPASLLQEIEESLEPNSYRMRLLEDGDREFDYTIPPERHSNGQYEIVLVIQKIEVPTWLVK